jgi:hypothetical protein
MQYVVTGGFGTVEEAVWVERYESMLAYCTLLQLSGTSIKLNQSDLGKRSSMDEHDQVTVVLTFKEMVDLIQ